MNTLKRWIWIFALAIFAVPSLASAQAKPGSNEEKRAKIEARLAQVRADLLRKRVGLDEATAKKVEAILAKRHVERRALFMDMRKHRDALKQLTETDSNDQAAYRRSLDALRKARERLHALRDAELEELSRVLSPKQQAQFAVSARQIERRLRKTLNHRGDKGGAKKDDPAGEKKGETKANKKGN